MTANSNNESGCSIFLLIICMLFIFLLKMTPFLLLITIIIPLILFRCTLKNDTTNKYDDEPFLKSMFLSILDVTIIPFLAFIILFIISFMVAIYRFYIAYF